MVGLADLDGWAQALCTLYTFLLKPDTHRKEDHLPQTQEGQHPVKGKQMADSPLLELPKVLKEGQAQILSELH